MKYLISLIKHQFHRRVGVEWVCALASPIGSFWSRGTTLILVYEGHGTAPIIYRESDPAQTSGQCLLLHCFLRFFVVWFFVVVVVAASGGRKI